MTDIDKAKLVSDTKALDEFNAASSRSSVPTAARWAPFAGGNLLVLTPPGAKSVLPGCPRWPI